MTDALLGLAAQLETRGNALCAAAALIRSALGPSEELGTIAPPPRERAAPLQLPAPKAKRARKANAQKPRAKKAPTAASVAPSGMSRKDRRCRVEAMLDEGKNPAAIAAELGMSVAGVAYIRDNRKAPSQKQEGAAAPRQ